MKKKLDVDLTNTSLIMTPLARFSFKSPRLNPDICRISLSCPPALQSVHKLSNPERWTFLENYKSSGAHNKTGLSQCKQLEKVEQGSRRKLSQLNTISTRNSVFNL